MHANAKLLMRNHLARVSWPKASVLDVGSMNVNGSYRGMIQGKGWKYTGLDLMEGPNVDIVTAKPYCYPFEDGEFDVVISGSTMEHVQAPWLWIPELTRLLRDGGLLVVVAPHTWALHRHPLDCWRILPDGMQYLFELTGELERCQFDRNRTDTVGSGFKVAL